MQTLTLLIKTMLTNEIQIHELLIPNAMNLNNFTFVCEFSASSFWKRLELFLDLQ